MKLTIYGLLMVFGLSCFVNAAENFDPMSLHIGMRTHRGDGEWTWTPKVDFQVRGGTAETVKFKVEIANSTGKPLFTMQCSHNGESDSEYVEVDDCGNELERESAVTSSGLHTFKVTHGGSGQVLYSGKFTINKFLYNPTGLPKFAKNFYYYTDYDWRLPVIYVGRWADEGMPLRLMCRVWLKGEYDKPALVGQLFYKGKMVAEGDYGIESGYTPEENNANHYSKMRFRFKAMITPPNGTGWNWWKLYENPGEYEIKILRGGEVARSVKFNIGADGYVVQNGLGNEIRNNIYSGIILQSTVTGSADGRVDPAKFKFGWWGNPISGF